MEWITLHYDDVKNGSIVKLQMDDNPTPFYTIKLNDMQILGIDKGNNYYVVGIEDMPAMPEFVDVLNLAEDNELPSTSMLTIVQLMIENAIKQPNLLETGDDNE